MRTFISVLLLVGGVSAPIFSQATTLSFSNQTAAAGISLTYVPGNFVSSEYIAPCACGDFDRDGDEDLFLLSGGGANGPDRLYINQGDGTFLDQAAAWGLTTVHRGTAVAVGDYDGDGWLDIYEASAGPGPGGGQLGQNKLYRNNGGTGFTNVATAAGVPGLANDSFGACFGDYDLDGDLDLFVGGFNSHKSRLYRNEGNGTFTNVTGTSGLSTPIAGVYCFSSHFADMNGDKYPELLISGDFGSSRYLRNNGDGTFTNITAASGTGKDENGMGGCLGDFNRDGRPDWYVASIHSVTVDPTWTGNKLYLNQGNHVFTQVAAAAGVNDGGYGWSSVGVDFNNDRWLDIAETNGAQWNNEWVNERSYLWLNNGNGTFTESSAASGLNDLQQGRGMLNFDYDLDGDEDLLIMANNQPARLWRNDLSGADTHWLRVSLDTNADPELAQHGYGSLVRVTAGGVQQTGHIFGGDNLQSQGELRAHFGLGDAGIADEVRVEWNDGRVTTLTNVKVDCDLTVAIGPVTWKNVGGGVAGASGPITLSGAGTLEGNSLATFSIAGANPNAPGTLFIGLSTLNKPLFGGIFVPAILTSLPIVMSPTGTMNLAAPWPAGLPTGLHIWFQAWYANAGGPFGPAASNGLRAITP